MPRRGPEHPGPAQAGTPPVVGEGGRQSVAKFAAGWLEETDTHKALSDAAYFLMNEGVLTDVRFNYVYAYDKPKSQRANGAAYVLNIPSAHMAIKRKAIYCYNTWAPDRNLYALG